MKKVKFLAMALAATTLIFGTTSCKKDDEKTEASLTVTQTNNANGDYVFHVDCRAGSVDLATLTVVNGTTYAVDTAGKTWDAGSTSNSVGKISGNAYVKDITFSKSAASKEFRFTLTDKDGVAITVTKTATDVTTGEISTFTATILGAQSNNNTGSSFAATTGAVYTQANAKTNATLVDMIYYFGSTNAEFISPKYTSTSTFSAYVEGWAKLNETKFTGKLASVDFDGITNANGIATVVSTPSTDKIDQLVKGDVFGFKTEGGKLGIAKVTDVVTGATGSITIDVKIAKN